MNKATGTNPVILTGYMNLLLIVAGSILALVIRYPMLPFESGDYKWALSAWWEFIDQHEGFPALASGFSVYNVPYLYILAAINTLFPGISSLTAIKVVSVSFDFVVALFVYLIVRLKHPTECFGMVPTAAGLVVLFAPTVLTNGALWGQCDSIYTAFLVAFLYFLLSGRPIFAFISYGFAFSFKLQAIFLAPFILWLIVVKREYAYLAYLFIVPIVYFCLIAPAWALGRSIEELLSIYWKQTQTYSVLTADLPNMYQWIPNDLYDYYPIGIAFTVIVVVIIAFVLYRRKIHANADAIVFLATFSVIITPYILPKMHQRYWFPAEVILIVLAFYNPRYAWIPVSLWSISSVAYIKYLFGSLLLPMQWLAIVPLIIIGFLVCHLPPSDGGRVGSGMGGAIPRSTPPAA